MDDIVVAVFEVGEKPCLKVIENELEPLREIVGGYIEMTRFPKNEELIIICNEEGKLHGLEPQLNIGHDVICGNFLIVRDNFDGELASVTVKDIEYLKQVLDLDELK